MHNAVTTARRQGDPYAVLRNAGAMRRPEPIRYSSSQAHLDASRARIRERTAAWKASDLGRSMRKIAVPPERERRG